MEGAREIAHRASSKLIRLAPNIHPSRWTLASRNPGDTIRRMIEKERSEKRFPAVVARFNHGGMPNQIVLVTSVTDPTASQVEGSAWANIPGKRHGESLPLSTIASASPLPLVPVTEHFQNSSSPFVRFLLDQSQPDHRIAIRSADSRIKFFRLLPNDRAEFLANALMGNPTYSFWDCDVGLIQFPESDILAFGDDQEHVSQQAAAPRIRQINAAIINNGKAVLDTPSGGITVTEPIATGSSYLSSIHLADIGDVYASEADLLRSRLQALLRDHDTELTEKQKAIIRAFLQGRSVYDAINNGNTLFLHEPGLLLFNKAARWSGAKLLSYPGRNDGATEAAILDSADLFTVIRGALAGRTSPLSNQSLITNAFQEIGDLAFTNPNREVQINDNKGAAISVPISVLITQITANYNFIYDSRRFTSAGQAGAQKVSIGDIAAITLLP